MARERMVTRTVVETVAKVMCVDVLTAQVEIQELKLGGTYTKTEDILKAIKKAYETEYFKCVSVQDAWENEVLYGMLEIDFIKLAKVLPPRGTKSEEE